MRILGAIWVHARVWGCLALLCTVSCSSHIAHSPYIKESLTDREYTSALKRVDRINKRGSRLLYLYEKGLVLHQAGKHEESNEAFEEAELLYDELYTKSISREVAALVTSDNVIKYRGEGYEIAFIHYYKLFNYMYLENFEGALVECRKLNQRLQLFADDEDVQRERDPFLEYLTGVVYAALGDYDDADVSFRVALESYAEADSRRGAPPVEYLHCDLIANAERLRDWEAVSRYRESAACHGETRMPDGHGVLNLFLECGYVPYKIEENIVIPLYKKELTDNLVAEQYANVLYARYREPRDETLELDYLLRVAIPAMVSEPFPYTDAGVRVTHRGMVYESRAHLVENIEALAMDTFEYRKGPIVVKTILRGLTKYLTKKGVQKKKGDVAGWLVNVFNVATESADTRSWTTLPANIRMSRLTLPQGIHDVEITLHDAFGHHDVSFIIPQVRITSGQTAFLNYRVY